MAYRLVMKQHWWNVHELDFKPRCGAAALCGASRSGGKPISQNGEDVYLTHRHDA